MNPSVGTSMLCYTQLSGGYLSDVTGDRVSQNIPHVEIYITRNSVLCYGHHFMLYLCTMSRKWIFFMVESMG